MAVVSDTGVAPKTFAEYRTDLQTAFRNAFGSDIDLGPKSPQGQFVDNLALTMSQSDDALISVAGASNIFMAFASQLEGLAALLGIRKNEAESTIVTATLGGSAATIVPAGSRAKSTSGDVYALEEDATIGVGGTVDATMAAVETGPIELGAGELTSVVDVVPGWETVTNSAAGATGRDLESDVSYRQRYFNELFKNALSVLESITAAVYEVDNVTEVYGVENDTASPVTIQNVSVGAHSVAIVVEGGLDADIAAAIRLKKTGGTATTGTTSVSDPPHLDINFFRPSYIDIEVTIETTAGTNFPADGVQKLKERTLLYINDGAEICSDGYEFEADGMTISEDLQKHRLYTPINSVPGHTVTALTLEDKASPGDVNTITADLNQKIRFSSIDDINVVLS